MRILAAILAGGGSRRFGADKALAEVEGRPLIAHVAEALGAQADAVVVCGREWGGLVSLPDRPKADMGPLGGLCAALHYADDEGYDAVLSVGCDTLPVPENLVDLLVGPATIAAFQSPSPEEEGLGVGRLSLTEIDAREDRPRPNPSPEGEGLAPVTSLTPAYLLDQPVIGLWPATLAPLLDSHLCSTTDLSLRNWARISGAIGVKCDATLTNVNTRGDLARYVREEAGHGLS